MLFRLTNQPEEQVNNPELWALPIVAFPVVNRLSGGSHKLRKLADLQCKACADATDFAGGEQLASV
jgi:hypothetical protein